MKLCLNRMCRDSIAAIEFLLVTPVNHVVLHTTANTFTSAGGHHGY
jgi:hypothetical protein